MPPSASGTCRITCSATTGGHFVDVTNQAGINDWHGQGLGVVATDLDGDGRLDLFVANDQSPNYFFHNLGGMKFEEIAEISGLAGNGKGGFPGRHGCCLRRSRRRRTTRPGGHQLLQRVDDLLPQPRRAASSPTIPRRSGWRYRRAIRLGFGTAYLDVDNDGHLDIAIANGHVDDFRPEIPYAMTAQLLVGSEGGTTDRRQRPRGTALASPAGRSWPGRG